MNRKLLVAVVAVGWAWAQAEAQQIIYVRANAQGGGNGSSWASAFNTLQGALAAATPGSEIWVAAGTYAETSGGAAFTMKSDVHVYGGFIGSETGREQRNPSDNETTLSGSTVRTVVLFNNVSRATLDGFKITGGKGSGSIDTLLTPSGSPGGGLHIVGGEATVIRCLITSNTGSSSWAVPPYGGGAFVRNSDAKFVECQFVFNRLSPPISSCQGGVGIVDGYPGSGCGMTAVGSTIRLDRCTFRGNQAGSGVNASPCSHGALTRLQHGGSGGALYAANCATFVDHCVFTDNFAGSGVGGCNFGEVAIPGNGGALCIVGGTVNITNSRFSHNGTGGSPECSGAAGGFGAAIYSTGALSVANCTFHGNSTIGLNANGGAVFGVINSITNSVLWANTAQSGTATSAQIGNGPSTAFRYCLIQNIPTSFGTANRNLDPLFVDPDGPNNIPGDADDRFDLSFASPAIDAGKNSLYAGSPFDLAGNPRFHDAAHVVDTGVGNAPIIDIGAIEFSHCPADLDDAAGSGNPDGAVTVDDLLTFVAAFESGAIRADLDDGSMAGRPDLGVTIDDLLFFLVRFEAGC